VVNGLCKFGIVLNSRSFPSFNLAVLSCEALQPLMGPGLSNSFIPSLSLHGSPSPVLDLHSFDLVLEIKYVEDPDVF
jgi:hypothetical protein